MFVSLASVLSWKQFLRRMGKRSVPNVVQQSCKSDKLTISPETVFVVREVRLEDFCGLDTNGVVQQCRDMHDS